ncbi:c-type cytochrome biogenesis protein CcmI [Aureimonas altamirensis]|uniref:c-type cytochrome biogenesis protein CcmI n=1 Tax=Aureimonas altamirensis TaxID=370622 RepID=UPI001E282DA0|nr:c-type cytochrome biogenesis protein CcmI [Aureimonas altamirensis]UHD44849.1 c-type cytochrome biogenesis protein CcmI [Aureimonas altamirensis]
MLFWIIAGALTVVVCLACVWPLLRREAAPAAHRTEHDMVVYRAQLDELQADVRRGVIAAPEAAIARAEIGRRLLKAADAGTAQQAPQRRSRSRPVAAMLMVAIPAAAIAGYLSFGSPDAGDMPLAAREATPDGGDVAALVAMAEARLATNPNEGQGWDALAPIYLRNGEATKAVNAYRRAIDILGPTPTRLSGFGEAQVMASEGRVTGQAAEAFSAALALDPQVLLPRFFLALQLMQQARFAEAADAWQALLNDSPADAPWRSFAEPALAEARARSGTNAVPTPDAAAAEIAALPPEERRQRIEGMVAGLAARLEAAPGDVEGWKRLIRSYAILGDGARAGAALQAAGRAFEPGTPERGDIAALAQELGLADALGGEGQ